MHKDIALELESFDLFLCEFINVSYVYVILMV